MDIETYDTSWEGDAYSTVSGQNSNNSVRVSNDFMQAVLDEGDWNLFWRTELDDAKEEGRTQIPVNQFQPTIFGIKYLKQPGLVQILDCSMTQPLMNGTHVLRMGQFMAVILAQSICF